MFDLYREVRAAADPGAAHARWCDVWRRAVPPPPRFAAAPRGPCEPSRPDRRPVRPGVPLRLPLEAAEPEQLEIPTSTDGVVAFARIGRLDVPGVGTLDVWWLRGYGGGLFVPFKDETAGVTSYGGGRYLLDTVKGADLGGDRTRLVVDLNFAYNPSCAYAPLVVPVAAAGQRRRCGRPRG